MVVMARSLPLIMRVMISVQAQPNADITGNKAAGSNALEPGRTMTMTPHSPTMVASQRRTPTFSPRNTMESAVTKSGATNEVADASAIGRKRSPVTQQTDDDSN